MPFGFHLAMDTLPSEELTSFFSQRGITPAFGYGPPHPSARRTSTFLNNALLSTHYVSFRRQHLGHTARRIPRKELLLRSCAECWKLGEGGRGFQSGGDQI